MSFDEPDEVGTGEYLKPEDLLNHLVLVWAVGYIADSPTRFSRPDKLSDVIVVDCVDLDNAEQPDGKLVRRAWWRNAKLIAALKGKVGSANPMLAVMVQGIPTKGMPPYELVSATRDAESVARANKWLAANPHFVPSQPQALPAQPVVATQQAAEPAQVARVLQAQSGQRQPAATESMLERMARIGATQQSASLPPRPPQNGDEARAAGGFEETIPF